MRLETAISEIAVSEIPKAFIMKFFDRTEEIASLREIREMAKNNTQFTVVTGNVHDNVICSCLSAVSIHSCFLSGSLFLLLFYAANIRLHLPDAHNLHNGRQQRQLFSAPLML